jgi:hypothetical protein
MANHNLQQVRSAARHISLALERAAALAAPAPRAPAPRRVAVEAGRG